MRRLSRALAPLLAVAALATAGGSSAFAAANPSSSSLDADFCYQSGVTTYCYDIDGSIHYLETTVGSSYTLEEIVRTTKYESGLQIGEAMSTQFGRGVFEADGTVVIDTVINTRSSLNGEPCTYRLVARLVNYEAVVYESVNTCI